MQFRRFPTASSAAALLLLAAVLGLGVYGMGRSLWLDESWVANSVREPSLHGMFYYPGWIQINPPLFLLLVRAAVDVAGTAFPDVSAAFRIVPLLLACVAVCAMLALNSRLVRAPLAVLAAAVAALDPTFIEYSRTLKPFTGEVAASACLLLAAVCYLRQPDRRRFAWLLLTAAIAIPLAYPSVFLLPGIALAVFVHRKSRGIWLCALAGAAFLPVWWFSIRPNLSPQLHEFWAANDSSSMNTGLFAALVFVLFAAAGAARRLQSGDRSPRAWACLMCALPCLLLAASAALGLYPISHRTRLFALPCFVLLAALTLEDLLGAYAGRRLLAPVAAVLTCGLIAFTAASQVIEDRSVPEEDFAGAIAFLEHYAAPSDLILVHACCKEGFLLYSGLGHWNPPGLAFGDTGWPCCARGKDARPGSSSAAAVMRDLDSKVPLGFAGRVWLLYTTRPTHWKYTGLDEGELWRKLLWDRGCPPGPYLRFANLALSPMNCAASRERGRAAGVYSKLGR